MQLILDDPVWRNALFSQSMYNQHSQWQVTRDICIKMFSCDPGWMDEMTRKGRLEMQADGRVIATEAWKSDFPDPVRNRLYT